MKNWLSAEFGSAALLVNPYDPEAVGVAISRAIAMPHEERIERHAKLFAALKRNDISMWGDRFLSSLTELPPSPNHRNPPPSPQPNISRSSATSRDRGGLVTSPLPAHAAAPRASRFDALTKI